MVAVATACFGRHDEDLTIVQSRCSSCACCVVCCCCKVRSAPLMPAPCSDDPQPSRKHAIPCAGGGSATIITDTTPAHQQQPFHTHAAFIEGVNFGSSDPEPVGMTEEEVHLLDHSSEQGQQAFAAAHSEIYYHKLKREQPARWKAMAARKSARESRIYWDRKINRPEEPNRTDELNSISGALCSSAAVMTWCRLRSGANMRKIALSQS